MCHLFYEVSCAQKWSWMWRSTWFFEVELCHVARMGCLFGVLRHAAAVLQHESCWFLGGQSRHSHTVTDYRNIGSSQRFSVSLSQTIRRRTRALRSRLLRMANRTLELVVWSDNSWKTTLDHGVFDGVFVCIPRGLCGHSPKSRGGSRTYADAACSLQTFGG